jgi:hypothetical protein
MRKRRGITYYLWDGSAWRVSAGELDPSTWLFTFTDGTQRQFATAQIIFGVAGPRKPPVGEHLLWIYYP